MNISKGTVYNIRRKIERSIKNVNMDARVQHRKKPKLKMDEWGVIHNGKKWVPVDSKKPVCCLLGAVLLDRQPPNTHSYTADAPVFAAAEALGINYDEAASIIEGFDWPNNEPDSGYEKLGQALNRIYVK